MGDCDLREIKKPTWAWRGGTPFCGETKGKERAAREVSDHIRTGERPQAEMERDVISKCGVFFGLGLAPCSRTGGGGQPRPGCGG